MSSSLQQNGTLGEFFAVDRRVWADVVRLGMNAAVAYLVLARGTGRDNRSTSWSIQAIERYTGISRSRAGAAVRLLCESRFIQSVGLTSRPQYRLVEYEALLTQVALKPLTIREQVLYERISEGKQPSGTERTCASRLVNKRYLSIDGVGNFRPAVCRPEWIWLPNALVTGAASETPPVELVRQMQDPMILRLLIDLYDAQNLREDGGVSRFVAHSTWERASVGEHAQYIVWGFRPNETTMAFGESAPVAPHLDKSAKNSSATYAPFWPRFQLLVRAGLIEWLPYLFESEDREAEAIHPYGIGGSDGIEDRIGSAAHEAALRLLTSGQAEWTRENNFWLAPVPRHIAKVAMIGVARLRYRPRTKLTAAWSAELHSIGERWFERYSQLRQSDRLAASR